MDRNEHAIEDEDQGTQPNCMSMDEARQLLLQKHNMVVDPNDALLLSVTLFQGFLSDLEKVLRRHNMALTEVIGGAIKGLTAEALSDQLQEQIRLADRIGREYEKQFKRAKLLTVGSFVSAVVCLPVLIYLVVK